MTATVTEATADAGTVEAEVGASRATRWGNLAIQPAIVVVVLIGFVIWRQTATLDRIEQGALRWRHIAILTLEHIELSVISTVIVLAVAIPLGVLLTRQRTRAASPAVVGFANMGQAAPAIGLIVLSALWLGIGFWPMVLPLCVYAILPVLRNTIVGIQGVDQRLVEAGRGMGMSAVAVLWRIELPLAVPVMLAGARTALVLLVGTATLGTLIGAGTLGDLINQGITLTRTSILISGALLVAVLALLIDWLGRLVEEIAKPKGI